MDGFGSSRRYSWEATMDGNYEPAACSPNQTQLLDTPLSKDISSRGYDRALSGDALSTATLLPDKDDPLRKSTVFKKPAENKEETPNHGHDQALSSNPLSPATPLPKKIDSPRKSTALMKPAENEEETANHGHGRALSDNAPSAATILPENNDSLRKPIILKKLADEARRRPTKLSANIFRNWWLELLAMCLVLAALIAITVTLATHQGRPLPQWPYKTSINSLVAIYVVVLKTAMLLVLTEGISQLKWIWYIQFRPLDDLAKFDSASRGPWGALQLIFAVRGRYVFVTVGAIVMIVALAIDPMAQLLIRYRGCDIQVQDASARIPTRNNFREQSYDMYDGVTSIGTAFQSAFQSAINAGMFNPESVKISFDCPTGNCTFSETYSTLGYCSSCTDITNDLARTCNVQNGTMLDPTWIGIQCNTSLTNGFSMDSTPRFGFSRGNITLFTMGRSHESNLVLMVFLNSTGLLGIDATGKAMTPYNSTAPSNGTDTYSNAANCNLFPCVRTYRASIEDHALTEDLLSTSAVWGDGWEPRYRLASVDNKCLSYSERQSLVSIGYTINETTDWIAYFGSGYWGNDSKPEISSFDSKVPNAIIAPHCLYELSIISLQSIDNYLSLFFQGSVTSTAGGYPWDLVGPPQAAKLFDAGNITLATINATFANVANSMTAYIRQYNGTNNILPQSDNISTVNGQVYRTETCVEIRWGYLVFPIILVASSLIFFVAMIIQTARLEGGHDWKSSPLPLLFHGLNDGIRERQEDLLRVNEMQRTAAKTHVRLRRKYPGWEFTEED